MALTLNNFTGFETQGAEEASAIGGTPTYPTTDVRSGGACLLLDGSSDSYTLPWVASGVTDAGGDYIFGGAVKFASLTEDIGGFIDIRDDLGGGLLRLRVGASGKIELSDNSATVVITSTNAVGTSAYHFIEVYFEFVGTNANAELFIDGVSEGTTSTGDFLASGTSVDILRCLHDGSNNVRFDDIYILSGAASAADRFGDFSVKTYQNTAEDATDQGDALADGTWALVSETPSNSGTSNDASYVDTGNLTGSTIMDEGDRAGPSGDSDVTGATIKGAKFISNLKRTSGGGRDHKILYGNDSDWASTSQAATADLGLTVDYVIHEVLTVDTNLVPTSSESFQQGFSKSATAGQDIFCGDQWAMLGYVPATGGTDIAASTDTLTLTENVATVNAETNVNAGVDALTLTENQATVQLVTNIAAGVDALTLTEFAASVNAETNVQANVDALTLTGQTATVNAETSIINVDLGKWKLVINASVILNR